MLLGGLALFAPFSFHPPGNQRFPVTYGLAWVKRVHSPCPHALWPARPGGLFHPSGAPRWGRRVDAPWLEVHLPGSLVWPRTDPLVHQDTLVFPLSAPRLLYSSCTSVRWSRYFWPPGVPAHLFGWLWSAGGGKLRGGGPHAHQPSPLCLPPASAIPIAARGAAAPGAVVRAATHRGGVYRVSRHPLRGSAWRRHAAISLDQVLTTPLHSSSPGEGSVGGEALGNGPGEGIGRGGGDSGGGPSKHPHRGVVGFSFVLGSS